MARMRAAFAAAALAALAECVAAVAPGWTVCPGATGGPFSDWNTTACPPGTTCAPNPFSLSGVGCSPYPKAALCNFFQSCPSGTLCSIISGNASDPLDYSSVFACNANGRQVTTSKCSCKPGPNLPPSTTLKNVLIIGDSVSIGYTPYVASALADIAQVVHAPWSSDGGAEEAAYAQQCLDFWLRGPGGDPYTPDLIFFNSGMHNLAVNGTPGHGTVPGQGGNSSEYAGQMRNVTARLVAFAQAHSVKLIFGLTSPMLCSVPSDAVITGTLNPAAASIMGSYGIPTVDLHGAITAKCGPVPQASCFGEAGCWCPHCPPGYQWLAESTIVPAIRAALQQ